jgi:hypothetical protein
MGKKTEAIFALDAVKKHSVLFREEGQTGDWKSDPIATLSASIYVMKTALGPQLVQGKKIRVTIEEID